jgi:hypothetical protein
MNKANPGKAAQHLPGIKTAAATKPIIPKKMKIPV